MNDLVEFLRARIADDAEGHPDPGGTCEVGGLHLDVCRLADECYAKQGILGEVLKWDHNTDSDSWFDCPKATYFDREGRPLVSSFANDPCTCGVARKQERIFRLLALPYSDHPDYREEWKP